MGVLVVESNRDFSRPEGSSADNDFKDKKKKHRSRKSKQPISGTSYESEICGDSSDLQGESTSSDHVVLNGNCQLPEQYDTVTHHVGVNGHHQVPKEGKAGVDLDTSLCQYANEHIVDAHQQNRQVHSCYESKEAAVASEDTVGPTIVARPIDFQGHRKCFPPHLSMEAVSEALKAYCKIDGFQTDVLINGVVAQNRAIEGDTVAVVIDPPSLWPRMKGSNEIPNSSASQNSRRDAIVHVPDCSIVANKLHPESEIVLPSNGENGHEDSMYYDCASSYGAPPDNGFMGEVLDNTYARGCEPCSPAAKGKYHSESCDSVNVSEKLRFFTTLYPSKRPTGRVISIIEKSLRRDNVVGFLSVKQWIYNREKRKNSRKNKIQSDLSYGYVFLSPNDPKFTKMMLSVRNLPESLKKRLGAGDTTIETDLVAAKVIDWSEESYIPDASVIQIFGRGSDVKAQLTSILFENAIDASEFSPEVLSCIPQAPLEVPPEELQCRRDHRKLCVFTIDPASATDLDDALSVEKLASGDFRVGVHIADVSYFVSPDSALDMDAQIRSTSVYLLQRKLPMLPSVLSDNLASLNPGIDKLAFSIFWDINSAGEVLDRWIGRTIIQSCCKLSYDHAQQMIDDTFDFKDSKSLMVNQWPKLYGKFAWSDVIKSVKTLHEISKVLRENRLKDGAVLLETPKISFLFDEEGMPYDSVLSVRRDSNYLVEEFMLLANRTAAEVITRAYPTTALLRRHPEPNARKLKDFEAFCHKHGLKLDTSSSEKLNRSLEQIKRELSHDSILFDILMSYAARPMQLASYFCSGDSKDASDLSHYALAVPLFTHFTSPLRRYPDIVVHRTLAAALEAEDACLKCRRTPHSPTEEVALTRCFSGLCFVEDVAKSTQAQEALSAAASKYRVPCTETLADVAAHCNEKKLAARHVKDAIDKLYMWVLLKKNKILCSEARVLGLGPRFMSVYIPKLAIERRIYYDEVEGLIVQWLEATSTLVLSQSSHKRLGRRSSPGKCKTLEEAVLIVNPADPNLESKSSQDFEGGEGEPKTCGDEPAFFPLTIHLLSTIPVALHAVGGDDGPLDIVARLYVSSYFHQL
ncbi:DIS3-like exonuclease 2 isoform X2 [Andrographis paniculata]|uniref:DIS3-like exonuclease 2 isoform X2 n=1 Tax=Andrographis paniculata TaxID=175694 RepID=UPI0021E8F114|nr:DIS3-like exonuclease 2 isoform X2 [Andrographis paniculata]